MIHVAVCLFDRYYMTQQIIPIMELNFLITLGAIFFNVARKYVMANDFNFNDIYNYEYMIANLKLSQITNAQSMIEIEIKIVCELVWNLYLPTVYSFLPFYIFISEYKNYPYNDINNTDTKINTTQQLIIQLEEPFECLVHCICERFLFEKNSFKLPFSQIAAFSIMLSRKILGEAIIWSCNLEYYTKYKIESLIELEKSFLSSLHKEVEYQDLQTKVMNITERIEVNNNQLIKQNTIALTSNNARINNNNNNNNEFYSVQQQLEKELKELQCKLIQDNNYLNTTFSDTSSNITIIDQALSVKYKKTYNNLKLYAIRQYPNYIYQL